jgi:hypothetical protein
MKQFQSYLNAVEQHINAGFDLGDAMARFAPVFNSAPLAQQVEMRNAVAYLIGTKKKVVPKVMTQGTNKGCMGFDAHGSEAEKQARDMLRYYLPSVAKKTVGKTPTPKKPDPIKAKAKVIKAWGLTKAQALKAVELAFAK